MNKSAKGSKKAKRANVNLNGGTRAETESDVLVRRAETEMAQRSSRQRSNTDADHIEDRRDK